MSRKFRNEQEYLRQLRQDAEEEEEIKTRQLKTTGPIEWAKLVSGFTVIDVTHKDYDAIIEMLKLHYIPQDVLCRNSEIEEDPVSMKSLLDHILFTLKDMTSIKAVFTQEDGSEALAGVLLLRVARKKDFDRVFSRTILQEGEARKKCVEIQTALGRKIDIYTLYNCDVFLRYYLLCIKPEYRKKGVGYQMLRVGLDVARSLGIPVASGIFNSADLQKAVKRVGFKLVQELSYTNWRDNNNELIFNDPGAGNYSCALMVAEVPENKFDDPFVITRMAPREMIVDVTPKTRAEKRAKLLSKNSN